MQFPAGIHAIALLDDDDVTIRYFFTSSNRRVQALSLPTADRSNLRVVASQFGGNFRCVVGGTIIDDHHLEASGQVRSKFQKRLHLPRQRGLSVVDGDNDAE